MDDITTTSTTTKSHLVSLLSHTTFAEADAFYENYIAGQETTSVLTVDKTSYTLPHEKALQILSLLRSADPYKEEYSSADTKRFQLPSLRILTPFEKRCQWLAVHFNVSLNDIKEFCRPDSIRVITRRFKLDFTPPDASIPYLDDDIGE